MGEEIVSRDREGRAFATRCSEGHQRDEKNHDRVKGSERGEGPNRSRSMLPGRRRAKTKFTKILAHAGHDNRCRRKYSVLFLCRKTEEITRGSAPMRGGGWGEKKGRSNSSARRLSASEKGVIKSLKSVAKRARMSSKRPSTRETSSERT